jgi:DNA transformation protein
MPTLLPRLFAIAYTQPFYPEAMGTPPKSSYVEFVLEQLAPLGTISARAMFGGYCLYCDGVVFALIANSVLYLKANAETKSAFLERDLQAFRPFEDKKAVMQYYVAPPEIFEHPEAMNEWVGRAIAAGKDSRPKKPRKRTNAKRPDSQPNGLS